jgi:glutamate dehydrogenase
MVSNFSGTLSPKGYLVLLSDENRILPSGELVESGIVFRNNFHLHPDVTGDFFVPCGGRPESVNLQNVDKMFKKDGTPRFKYIVEGANLFFSEGARKKLEDAGVILFKDSSTNKGGVTSSSFEV